MKRLITAAALTIATAVAFAENCTFPSTSGDLASATDWGRAVPGENDSVRLIPGSYSFGSDVTFTNIYLSAAGTYDFTATGRSINLLAENHQIDLFWARKDKVYANLTGGTWDFGGHEFRGMENKGKMQLFGGAKITNAANFYAKYYHSNGMATFYMTGGSSLDCAGFYASHKGGNITVMVDGGAKINASGEFCTDSRNTERTDVSFWNYIYVQGAGSEINTGSMKIGLKNRDDIYFFIQNGGKVTTTGEVRIGEGGGKRAQLRMDQGTLVVGGSLSLPWNSTTNNNCGIQAKDSKITVAGNYDASCALYSSCDFQNVDFTVTGDFKFFQQRWNAKQRLRFGGVKGTQPASAKFTEDIFGTVGAGGNTLVIDDHFRFEQGNKWFRLLAKAHDSALIVTNYATYYAPSGVPFGYGGADYASGTNNMLKIVDHATFQTAGAFSFNVPFGGKLIMNNGSSLLGAGGISLGASTKACTVSIADSTLTTDGGFSINYTENPNCGNVFAITNTTITCSNAVYYGNNGGYTDLQNVTFNLKGGVWNPKSNGKPQDSIFCDNFANRTLRLGGAKGNRPWGTSLINPYGGQNGNMTKATLIIDDGFAFTNTAYAKMMTGNRQCKLRVSGGAKYYSTSTTFIGYSDYNTSFSNAVEIVDGGMFEGHAFYLMGTDNTMVISNGSLEVSANLGFGYQPGGAKYPTSGSKVLIAGETPRLEAGGSLWLYTDSETTIAIPAAGYAEGREPVNAGGVVFYTTASLKLDCADYLASEAGDTTLMTFRSSVGGMQASNNSKVTFAQWVRAQNAALGLPSGVPGLRLVADGSGSKLVFRKEAAGFMVIVR